MTGVTLISKNYIHKSILVNKAKEIAKELSFEIFTEKLYCELDDLNFYIDIDDDLAYLITIWCMDEEQYKKDKIQLENETYFIAVDIEHDSEALPYLNKFLIKFLRAFPEMLVGDELHDAFYSISQIEGKDNLPKWLLV